jgi:predicted nucleic acid-binding protein
VGGSRRDAEPGGRQALKVLRLRGDALYVSAQNLVEFWSNATRGPGPMGGLNMTPARAAAKVRHLRRFFRFAPDTPDVYEEFQRLVESEGITGVLANDARLVAVMRVYGLTHVLTFNVRDFTRFSGITVIDPNSL